MEQFLEQFKENNIDIILSLYHEEIKKTPETSYFNLNEWNEFYMDSEFYENIKDNIEIGDYIQINNGFQNIWCEVKRSYKNIKENQDKELVDKILILRIDNIITNQNYSYNTIINIKFIHILNFCKKDELLSKFIQY